MLNSDLHARYGFARTNHDPAFFLTKRIYIISELNYVYSFNKLNEL